MFLGTLFWEEPDPLAAWLADELGGEERIVGLRKTSSVDPSVEAPAWLLVTTERNALVAHDGERANLRELPIDAAVKVDKSITRVTWTVGDHQFDALRLTSGDLEELVELAFESRPRMLFLAGQAHAGAGLWREAQELWAATGEALEGGEAFSSEGFLPPAQEVLLRRSVAAAHDSQQDLAIDLLAQLSQARPDDDLVASGERVDAPGDWWLMLALAHEEAGEHAGAAAVYERLHGQEADDVFLVSRARNLRAVGAIDDALAAYVTFVTGRADEDFRLVAAQTEQAEDLGEAGDVGVTSVLLEAAEMLREEGRAEEALEHYLGAIRHTPYRSEGFAGLFDLADEVSDDVIDAHRFELRQASEILGVVLPRLAEELQSRVVLVDGETERPWEDEFEPIDDETHDQKIVHEGERASSSLAQKWAAVLLKDERDTGDIVRHAQPADRGDFPAVETLLDNVSRLLGIERPRAFLSHGSSGIDVLGRDEPFVLIGAAHLDRGSPRALTDSELAFAIASQLEHIRAGHLILTSSEFWKTFGTKSMTAILAFVPMGDLVGKFTDGAVLKWFDKLKGAPSASVGKLAELMEKRIEEGEGRETIQSAYTATLGKLRQVGLASTEGEESHMVKERLADFARCAQFTADRVGLLVNDDLSDSVAAILKLSPSFADRAAEALDEGLAAVLSERTSKGRLVHGELALRLGELMKFAMSDEFADLREAARVTSR